MSNPSPVFVDLGKKKRKAVKKLSKGQGPLVGKVSSIIDDLVAAGTISEGAQPVVVVVRARRRKNVGSRWMGMRR